MREGARRMPGAAYRGLVVVSVVSFALVALMATTFAMPIEPDCFEWCGLGRYIATAAISLIAFLWLAVFLTIAWGGRAAVRGFSIASAGFAAVSWAALAGMVVIPWSPDSAAYAFFQLTLLLAIGTSLPATWRLVGGGGYGPPIVIASAMGLAVAAAVVAYVAIGTTWWTTGPTIQWIASLVWEAGLVLLIALRWGGPTIARAALGLLAIGAASDLVTGVLALWFSIAIGVPALVPFVILAAGWGLLAVGWARHDSRQSMPEPSQP
jgi:hypothetical protein